MFKNDKYAVSQYLLDLNNTGIRTILTKLRTNWYCKIYKTNVSEDDKLCKLCKVQKSDTVHILLKCSATVNEKEAFVSKIIQHFNYFERLSDLDKINYLLNDVVNNIISYKNIWDILESYLEKLSFITGW